MAKIITIKDNITQETAYPITRIDAIITEGGSKFSEELEMKLSEVNQLLLDAVYQAQAAEDSIKTLTNFGNSTAIQQTISDIINQVEINKTSIISLLDNYKTLTSQINNFVNKNNISTEVTGEVGKIPTSMAVRNYVTDRAQTILDKLIDSTTIEPNYIPEEGSKILINTENNDIYISPGNADKWFKLKAEVLELPEALLSTNTKEDIIEFFGDLEIDNQDAINIPNHGKVEDDTLIL